jgi:hypothetical protein
LYEREIYQRGKKYSLFCSGVTEKRLPLQTKNYIRNVEFKYSYLKIRGREFYD